MVELALDGGVHHAVVLIGGLAVSFVAYVVGTAVYHVWFHPLAKVPGPKLWATSDMFYMWKANVCRNMSIHGTSLHRKYGPMVRVGPDRVLVDGSIAWSQVHGRRSNSEDTEFSKFAGTLFPDDHMSIIGANRETHRRQRRHMAHAFSAAAMHEQEGIISGYVDKLMSAIEACARKGETLNIVHYFNYATFDIIGDLAFADSFGSLDGNTTFVDNAFRGLIGNSLNRFLYRFPLMRAPLMLMFGSKELAAAREAGLANNRLGREKARARMALDDKIKESGRRDFATYMLRRGKDGEEILSTEEIEINSQVLVIAGSETTATALSGAVFHLSRPEAAEKRRRLVEEIRTAFTDEAAIDMTSTAHLEYLHAAIEEVLRVYPPAASVTPRQSPGAEVNGVWLPKGTGVLYDTLSSFGNPAYFKNPDTFVPERWLKPSHPFHDPIYDNDRKDIFKPFSAGPRDCIGKNLAYAEMRVTLARLLFRFDLEVLPGQDNWTKNQTTTPLVWIKEGLEVRPTLRKGLGADKE
ncbi:cytochrome P450 [Microdochium bolleyi]|uniref:Cytochrome P450 n=1 Tax=Microdochium bolleyi TaxID=196109 RepID=A0A136IN95_9PEZI|nr:cytochrome P450 [Microdochium bolleyi]